MTETPPLPEAPISIAVMAYLRGFQVLITKRMGEQPILSQIPGVVALVRGLVDSGFEPARETRPTALLGPEAKENPNPICPIHHKPMTWREGVSSNTNQRYAFWTCTEKNSDGSFCKYRPEKSK